MTRTAVRSAIVALAAIAGACEKPSIEQVETTAAVPVQVEAARRDTIAGVLSVTGSVVPAPGAELTVVAPEAARIAELPKAEGDRVQPGDVLVRYDIPSRPAELTARRAEVAQATVRVTTARAAVTRLTGLVERGVAAQRELDDAKREQADAESALAQAQGAAQAAEALESRSTVRATFAGTIARRWHNAGDLVDASASDPILRVIDTGRLQVLAAVPIGELAKIAVGRAAEITGPGGGDAADAKVVALPAEIETDRATAGVRLAFEKPPSLLANAAVTVDITTASHKDVVVVPAAAVVKNEDGTFVFVVGADNKAHRQAVTLGLASREDVEVATGVAAGDRVVVHGQDGLPDGAAVTIEK